MKHALWTGVSFGVAMAISAVAANAFTLTGKVNDESGKAVQNAAVSLLGKALNTKTDASGAFTIHQDESCVPGTPGCDGGSDALVQRELP